MHSLTELNGRIIGLLQLAVINFTRDLNAILTYHVINIEGISKRYKGWIFLDFNKYPNIEILSYRYNRIL